MHNTDISSALRTLHAATLDIVTEMMLPQRDLQILEIAEVRLDRALFPLLVLTDRLGPIGLGELADRVGRDHTTVSRQAAKLQGLGLIERRLGESDRRTREAVITEAGKQLVDRIDRARDSIMREALQDWSRDEVIEMTLLVRRYADALRKRP